VLINPILSLFTDHITAISKATKEALVKYENFKRNRIKVIYNGIDGYLFNKDNPKDIRREYGITENAFVMGTIARLDPIKNQQMMLRSLKLIQRLFPQTVLIIVGDGPQRESLEVYAKNLGIASNVIFAGFQQETHHFYNVFDVFLLTSFSEGTAMTLLEAMAAGTAIVATDVGGNPEIILDNETGFIIPSNNEIVLADKICTLIKSPELKKKMGIAGRERFDKYFTANNMERAYEALYEKKIKKQGV
jgi:glycosyltransferase involved in cell wall biosynthesis